MSELSNKIDTLSSLEKKLAVKRTVLLDKALRSEDPSDIIKAQTVLNSVETREHSDRKSYLIDPNEFTNSLGFRNKPLGISYEVLRRMSLTPIINAIIKTRINQIAAFVEPQKDRYSTGFVIEKKGAILGTKMTKQETKRANEITDILLSCGQNNSWANDDFDTFTRKVMRDSLMYDQLTWENVTTKRGEFYEMVATDAGTIRLAETYDDDSYKVRRSLAKEIKGYKPSYVQIYQDRVVAEYYPWELCFGVRNPSTSIHGNGYGTSELEELIQTITAILWADEYNRKFFSQGSAPKGILRVDASVSPQKLQEFKQQWQAMVSGVYNAWKTPILESGKMDFVNLQTNNRDMEYSKWNEYLIKTACSIYSIDPDEVGFKTTAASGSSLTFESGNESRLKHSQDKGLYPLLKFYQSRLNKHVIGLIDPEYQLRFVGYDSTTREGELDMMVKKVTNLITLDEAREEMGYKPLKVEGVSENVQSGIFSQFKMMAQQSQQTGGEEGDEEQPPMNENDNPFEEQ